MSHTHDGLAAHSHESNVAEHGHSHEILDGPGSYAEREMPIIEGRDWTERAFTVGIGGYAPLLQARARGGTIQWLTTFWRQTSGLR